MNDLKTILQKPVERREEEDITNLIPLLYSIKFFKECKLSHEEMRFLAETTKLEHYGKDEAVCQFGMCFISFTLQVSSETSSILLLKAKSQCLFLLPAHC